MKHRVKTLTVVLLITGIVSSLSYFGYVCVRCTAVYIEAKHKERGWKGKVHRYDRRLGFAPVPGATGAHVFPVGPDIPMHYDRNGFRAVVGEDPAEYRRPLFLFLGCSYTYGDACRAEETFASLVGHHFNATALNAGVCGYGLSQMHILADQLIPRYKPDVVIVQFSDWLANRATREFSPTYFFKIPYPYYTDSGDGFRLAPPVYRTAIFDKDLSFYRLTPPGVTDYLGYMSKAAVPLKIAEDMKYYLFLIKKTAGRTPRPTARKQELFDFFYDHVHELSLRNGGTMIIVGLRNQSFTIKPEFIYINAETALRDRLASLADYDKTYAHWRGDPPVKVDNHPNALAHRIIAQQLIKKIETLRLPAAAARTTAVSDKPPHANAYYPAHAGNRAGSIPNIYGPAQ